MISSIFRPSNRNRLVVSPAESHQPAAHATTRDAFALRPELRYKLPAELAQ